MPNQNFIKIILAMILLITITMAPFLDSVACDHCHSLFPEKVPIKDYVTITNPDKTLDLHKFFAYETRTSEKHSRKGNISCPFCVFNIFGVISNIHFEVQFSSTSLLKQKVFLALVEPVFLKIRPPKTNIS
jgi:hypothetical protein